jgi:hypothetical protein
VTLSSQIDEDEDELDARDQFCEDDDDDNEEEDEENND